MNANGFLSEMKRKHGTERVTWWIVTILVSGTFSFAIVYANVQSFDIRVARETGLTDVTVYMAMYSGQEVAGIGSYRPLVPEMARLVPDIPSTWFGSGHRADPATAVAVKFAVLNLLFLVGACLALFSLQLGFGLSEQQSFVGVMAFLAMRDVIRTAGLPLVDTAFYFFFLLTLIAILRDRFWLLLAAAAIGVAGKELVLLCVPLVLLSTLTWKRRLVLLAATVPAAAVYVAIRLFYASSAVDGYLGGQSLFHAGEQLRALVSPNGFINLFLAFGVVWILAIYAFFKSDIPPLLRRWTWLVPLVSVGVILGQGNIGRSNFTAFPVVILLAVFGLKTWLWRDEEPGPQGTHSPDQLCVPSVSS